jgi:hypothetical protein
MSGWNALKLELAAALNDNSKIEILLANFPYSVVTGPISFPFF